MQNVRRHIENNYGDKNQEESKNWRKIIHTV